jgi:hypothetical protein
MSKLNIGVGDDFPLDDAQKQDTHPCEAYMQARHSYGHGRWRRRHRGGPLAALLILPAAAASVTAAIVYPLATLGVIGGLGVAAAVHRRRRWERYREAYRKYRAGQDKPNDSPEPPKEST